MSPTGDAGPNGTRPGARPGRPGTWRRMAWLPIPLLSVGMATLWAAELRVVWPLPLLLWLLHYGGVALAVGLIVIPAARSFLANRQASVLMLGTGVLAMEFGVTAMLSAFGRSSDTAFAIYNISAVLGALCHFAGVAITSRRRTRLSRPSAWLAAAYGGAAAAMGLVIWATLAGRMPAFFVEDLGGTLLRTVVVATAVAFFLLTSGLLLRADRGAPSPFLFWYALGLALLAAGLAGSLVIEVRDSPLQWVARVTQNLGIVYMCVAMVSLRRKTGLEATPMAAVEEAWEGRSFVAGLRRQTPLGWLARYGTAFTAVAVALGSRLGLEAWFGPGLPTYITFYPAVMAVALLAGFGPGILVTGLTALMVAYWVLPPIGSLAIAAPVDRLGVLIFLCMGLFMSAIAELYRRSRDRAASYAREAQATRSQKTFVELVERAPFGIYVVDSRFRISQMNVGSQTGAFRNVRPVIGRDFSEAMHILWPETVAAEIIALFRHTLETGEPYYSPRFTNPRHDVEAVESYEWELHRLTLPDGQYGVVCYYFDSTRMRDAEEALRELNLSLERRVVERTAEVERANAYNRNLIETSLDPLVTISLDGKVTDVNEATVRVTGVSRGTLIGTDFSDYFTEPENAREGYKRVFAQGSVTDYPLTIRRRDGRLTDVLYNASVYGDTRGNVLGVFAAARDITERKRAEAALREAYETLETRVAERTAELARSNKDLEQFAYVTSHDLQEPLRMMASYSGLLERRYREKLDADANEFLDFIVDGAKRMQGLINDLLAYSRLGRAEKEFERVDCDAVIARVVRSLTPVLEESGASLTRDPLPVVSGHATELSQLFQNLIANALKFRGADAPKIHVGAAKRDGEWVFSVQDNGIGIETQYRDRIFVIFQRLHKREEYPGTGIGLAICKKIVETHGGRIWVESEHGKGSTFFFTIPVGKEGSNAARS